MPSIDNKWGFGVLGIVWLLCSYVAVNSFECQRLNACTADDLFLATIFGLGMLAPAWLAGALVSVVARGD